MDIFIITSTLKPKVGVIDDETRYNQTFKTIDSIRQKAPDSIIFLFDSSPTFVEDYKLKELKPKVDYFISLSNHTHSIELGNKGLKDAAECYIMIVALDIIKNLNFKNVRRIFKITGRSELTDDFDINYYSDPEIKGKYVFKAPVVSWISPTLRFLDTKIWSFSHDMIDETDKLVRGVYDKIMSETLDMHHIYFKLIDKEKLIEKDVIGLFVQSSKNGEFEYV